MTSHTFTDKNGEQLIVRHRKSAVFFEREANPINVKMDKIVLSWRNGPVVYGEERPHFLHGEKAREYQFSEVVFNNLFEYLTKIAHEVWNGFQPKVADSIGADYDSAWDREHEDEMNLSFWKNNGLRIEGPHQEAKTDIVRLYKFNKRKFESFIFDFERELKKGAPQ